MQKRTGLVIVLSVVAAVGCAHNSSNYPLMANQLVPAASGTVTLKNKDDVNKTLIVRVHHLAPPENLSPEAAAKVDNTPAGHSYVVWLQATESNPPDNIGVLIPDKNLDAELTATTTQKKFNLFVTAEPSPTQNAPTGQHLLQATVAP
jgi:hypothetical protein